MSMDGQGTRRRRKIAENFNRLSRCTNVTDIQTTDGTAIAYIIANVNVNSRSLKTGWQKKLKIYYCKIY